MAKKEGQRAANEQFFNSKKEEEGVMELNGILYSVIAEGSSTKSPLPNSVVTAHYRGTLINGREFDNSWKRSYPEAFRVSDLIEGFQIALTHMYIGDRWLVYIPWVKGYGKRSSGPIPAFSTLIFEIELISIS